MLAPFEVALEPIDVVGDDGDVRLVG